MIETNASSFIISKDWTIQSVKKKSKLASHSEKSSSGFWWNFTPQKRCQMAVKIIVAHLCNFTLIPWLWRDVNPHSTNPRLYSLHSYRDTHTCTPHCSCFSSRLITQNLCLRLFWELFPISALHSVLPSTFYVLWISSYFKSMNKFGA